MSKVVREMLPKWVAITSYIASALGYLLALFTGNIRVETAQSNGLAEIQYPYSGVSFFATLVALGVLFFGITLSFAILRGRTAKPRRPLLGSGLLSSGVLAILFAVFWYSVNVQDAGPRCLGGCVPSLEQYLQGIFVASTLLGLSGLVAAGFGAWLLMRRAHPIQSSAGQRIKKD
ncbi:MAG: hypothetical protein LYZ70_00005 [Nitrososphaerales archaeon]|nr:hypothetical protein [Nitrososphaerales archaeon]